MSFSERIQQLNEEIGAAFERTLSGLRQEVQQAADSLRASNDEILSRLRSFKPELPSAFVDHADLAHAAQELQTTARAESRDGAFRDLRDGVAALDKARSQAEILTALLAETGRFASRGALLLVRGGELRGWGGHGFHDSEQAIRDVTLDLPADSPWGRVTRGEGALHLSTADCATFCSRIESPLPRAGVLVPLVLRDRVAAALYADGVDGTPIAAEALQSLAYVAALAIESLAFRERSATATLNLVGEPASAAAAAPSAPTPAVEPPAAAPAGVHEPEPEPAPHAEAEEPYTAPPAPESPESPAATAAWATPSAQPAGPTREVDLGQLNPYLQETPAAAPAPEHEHAPEPAASAHDTVLLQRSAFRDPVPAPWGRSDAAAVEEEETAVAGPAQGLGSIAGATPLSPLAAAHEPAADEGAQSSFDPLRSTGSVQTPAAGATPEVRPPSGVQGPGWAFATTRLPVSPSDEALHEEARRLARLLVSEIKLYNEEQVEAGRRNRDIYERLREDIDRSRQMYEERVDPKLAKSTDYFYQELVRILAAGDSKALGI